MDWTFWGIVAPPAEPEPDSSPEDDDYDPRDAAYITQVSHRESDARNLDLLAHQIHKLEAALVNRGSRISSPVRQHYEYILEDTRRQASMIEERFGDTLPRRCPRRFGPRFSQSCPELALSDETPDELDGLDVRLPSSMYQPGHFGRLHHSSKRCPGEYFSHAGIDAPCPPSSPPRQVPLLNQCTFDSSPACNTRTTTADSNTVPSPGERSQLLSPVMVGTLSDSTAVSSSSPTANRGMLSRTIVPHEVDTSSPLHAAHSTTSPVSWPSAAGTAAPCRPFNRQRSDGMDEYTLVAANLKDGYLPLSCEEVGSSPSTSAIGQRRRSSSFGFDSTPGHDVALPAKWHGSRKRSSACCESELMGFERQISDQTAKSEEDARGAGSAVDPSPAEGSAEANSVHPGDRLDREQLQVPTSFARQRSLAGGASMLDLAAYAAGFQPAGFDDDADDREQGVGQGSPLHEASPVEVCLDTSPVLFEQHNQQSQQQRPPQQQLSPPPPQPQPQAEPQPRPQPEPQKQNRQQQQQQQQGQDQQQPRPQRLLSQPQPLSSDFPSDDDHNDGANTRHSVARQALQGPGLDAHVEEQSCIVDLGNQKAPGGGCARKLAQGASMLDLPLYSENDGSEGMIAQNSEDSEMIMGLELEPKFGPQCADTPELVSPEPSRAEFGPSPCGIGGFDGLVADGSGGGDGGGGGNAGNLGAPPLGDVGFDRDDTPLGQLQFLHEPEPEIFDEEGAGIPDSTISSPSLGCAVDDAIDLPKGHDDDLADGKPTLGKLTLSKGFARQRSVAGGPSMLDLAAYAAQLGPAYCDEEEEEQGMEQGVVSQSFLQQIGDIGAASAPAAEGAAAVPSTLRIGMDALNVPLDFSTATPAADEVPASRGPAALPFEANRSVGTTSPLSPSQEFGTRANSGGFGDGGSHMRRGESGGSRNERPAGEPLVHTITLPVAQPTEVYDNGGNDTVRADSKKGCYTCCEPSPEARSAGSNFRLSRTVCGEEEPPTLAEVTRRGRKSRTSCW